MNELNLMHIVERDFKDKVCNLKLKDLISLKFTLYKTIDRYEDCPEVFSLKIRILDEYIKRLESINFPGSIKESKIAKIKHDNKKRRYKKI